MQIYEQMFILGNPGFEYFKEFNLPKEYIDYFASIKFKGISEFDKILNEHSLYSNDDAKNATDLIMNMLRWDYNNRYSAELCLNHHFLK